MAIERISIHNLRNITDATLNPAPRLNLIIGPNGSGKTTLLEAIYLLSTGRSFRANRNQQLLREGSEELLLFCETRYHGRHRIGLQKSLTKGSIIHLDGAPINSSSSLALQLPVLLINPEHHRLIEDGPPVRRAFLDWALFHVKPEFLPAWKQYERCRKQRNTALRSGKRREVTIWHEQMAQAGEHIARLRSDLTKYIIPQANQLFNQISQKEHHLSISYHQGWNREKSLADILDDSLDSDLACGFTQAGPHRSDLVLRIRNQPVDRELSRGEQKLLVFALRLALLSLLDQHGIQTHLLIDDLASELDAEHRARILNHLLKLNQHQIFITATDASLTNALATSNNSNERSVFHVKHGSFSTFTD